jgi:hypothetical protein
MYLESRAGSDQRGFAAFANERYSKLCDNEDIMRSCLVIQVVP